MSNPIPTPLYVGSTGAILTNNHPIRKWECYIYNGTSELFIVKGVLKDEAEANAAHIVKCVHLHDELVAELAAMVENFKDTPREMNCYTEAHINAARAVLAKARAS